MASFVPLHGSWCWFKVKARARKVPGRARASDDQQPSEPAGIRRLLGRESCRVGFRRRR